MPRLLHVLTVPESLLFLRGQARWMRAQGFDVSVVTSPGEGVEEFEAEEGVRVYRLPMQRAITPGKDLVALAKLTAHVRALKPDLVHSHTPKGGLLGMLAARASGVPSRVYHLRGLILETAQGARRALLESTERTTMALAQRVLCNSHTLRTQALDLGLCPPEKLVVLGAGSGNGVDAEGRFNPASLPPGTREAVRAELGVPQGALLFGFVGRLVGDKGVHELQAAWERLRTRLPDAHLLLVGRFEERDPVAPTARRALEADTQVHLAGFRADTPRLYAAMDVLALPTYREGFPNVPLEAAAMRLPVVSTRVPGCLDAVEDGVTGLLVPARDDVALERALLRYGEDAGLRLEHGAAGQARVRRLFQRERVWEGILATYQELLAATR